jgi:hypothetical protein
MVKRFVNVGSLLIADREPTVVSEPRQPPLIHLQTLLSLSGGSGLGVPSMCVLKLICVFANISH